MGKSISSALELLLESMSVEQIKNIKGKLTVDYDEIEKFTKESKETLPEEVFITKIIIMAYSCLQPVNIKLLTEKTGITTRNINKYRLSLTTETELKRQENRDFLIGTLDTQDYLRLMNPKAPIETSKFVRKNVLGQELEREEGDIIKINNLEITMNSDMRTQIINSTAGHKELFFNGEGKALPEQIKPTDDFLNKYVEDIKEVVEEKVKQVTEGVTDEEKKE